MDRLPQAPTQRIDRNERLSFQFLGRDMEGHPGDTVASAMYGEGVRIFSRSLKYHRPRGLYSLDGECANALVDIDGIPNESAELVPLKAGMSVTAQNVRGDPGTDRYGIIDRFDRMMPAGFYYNLFHRPYRLWPFFQDQLRKMAGVGVLDPTGEPEDGNRFERYLNAEVAVVGGGPAGMAAALAAAESGIRVCLFERRPWLGGHWSWRTRTEGSEPLHVQAKALAERVRATPNIRAFTHAPVTGVWGENLVTGFMVAPEDGVTEVHYECRAAAVVVAAGCTERPLVFNHNDRPGVMQASAAWRLAATYGVAPGERIVFSVGDDLGIEAASELAALGIDVAAVADARAVGHDEELVQALEDRGIPFLRGWAAREAKGRRQVTSVQLASLDGAATKAFSCDGLAASAGLQALIGPLSTAKARLAYDRHTGMYGATWLPPGVFAAGSMTGLRDMGSLDASGRLAGLEAAAVAGHRDDEGLRAAKAAVDEAPGPRPGCALTTAHGSGRGNKAFVDYDEDGTYKNVVESAKQGFDVPELAKRFGGFGLGPGQYRVPGQNLAMIMAELSGITLEDAKATTVRPPLVPPRLATMAGPGHHVRKQTPLHDEQANRGAIWRRAGVWERARFFSDDFACLDEIRNVRTNVGLLDSSPLGKFRIYGPDALNALQRVYISDMSKTKPSRCKYSAMCNDMGHIVDDGVIVEVGENDYYFTTSSNRAGSTVEWFRYHTRYDGWNYNLVNITDTLGSLNLAGPRARDVLEKITDEDVSNEAFPYMGYREIVVGAGVEVRCLRLGFVGELSFELHSPSSYCQYVWDLLMEAGAEFGIQPFGLEAQYSMRAEKGHVIIGAESEQRVTLTDIGMGFLWAKADTTSLKVGAPALHHCAAQEGRMKLIGLRMQEGSAAQDGNLVISGDSIVGYVCTTRTSETLGWQYALALVEEPHTAKGNELQVYENLGPDRERRWMGTVVPPHFYDPKGERLRA